MIKHIESENNLVTIGGHTGIVGLLDRGGVSLAGGSGLGAGGLGGLLLLGGTALLSKELGAADGQRVGVELDHGTKVLEGVLLQALAHDGSLGGADLALNLIGVDDAGNIRVGHDTTGEGEARLLGGLAVDGAEDGVHALKSSLGPDDEAAHVSTRSELEQVEAVSVAELHTGKVAEGLDDTVVLGVDNEGTEALDVTAVAHLTLTTTELAGGLDLLDVIIGTDGLEGSDGLLGALDGLGGVVNNAGDLSDLRDAVTTSKDQRGKSRSSQSRGNGVALLVGVDLAVPLAPSAGGVEHATFAAHVTESSLARARGTTTGDAGDTGNGTAGTPGLGGVLVASGIADGVRLNKDVNTFCKSHSIMPRNNFFACHHQEWKKI